MAKDRVQADIGTMKSSVDWESIDWQRADRRVTNLRRRIFRAAQNGEWNQVRNLMKLMLRSYSNILQSVRRVTHDNKGKKTPGVDAQVVVSPRGRMALVRAMLARKAWRINPARRVYIPKSDGKQRPLGILTIKNRVAQAVVKNALEPCWEAQFEQHSYGFRPGRSAHDAIEQCFRRLNKHCGDTWVLDADIKVAFDNISHDFLLQRLGSIPGRGLIRKWLKAGYVEAEMFNATTDSVPQGEVISPLLANIAMDGMQSLLSRKFGFIRYADDFVITAKSKEQYTGEDARSRIEKKLRETRLWTYLGDESNPYVVFDFTKSRKRDGPAQFLKGYKGYLQADAFAGYDCIFAGGEVVEVACMAHVRRKFFEAQTSGKEAQHALAVIQELYLIEKEAKELEPNRRQEMRQVKSLPLLQEFKIWLDRERLVALPKSPLGKAVMYALNNREALNRFIENGNLTIDNNRAENALRKIAIGRKNWLFLGSESGGHTASIFASVVASCNRHLLDPFAYLKDVFQRLAANPNVDLESLLPDRWQREQTSAAA